MYHLLKHEAYESGQGLVEYALILLLMAIVVIGAVTLFGNTLLATFQDIEGAVSALI